MGARKVLKRLCISVCFPLLEMRFEIGMRSRPEVRRKSVSALARRIQPPARGPVCVVPEGGGVVLVRAFTSNVYRFLRKVSISENWKWAAEPCGCLELWSIAQHLGLHPLTSYHKQSTSTTCDTLGTHIRYRWGRAFYLYALYININIKHYTYLAYVHNYLI